MSDIQPPLGGVAPPLQCSRLMSGSAHGGLDSTNADYCGKPATWHIIWTADVENGLACDEHADEARRLWVYFGLHPYDPICSMNVAVYRAAVDRCVIEEDDGDLSVAASAAVPVPVGASAVSAPNAAQGTP